LTRERQLLAQLNGALFSLAGLHDLVADLGGSDRPASHLTGKIHLLEAVTYHLILEVEGSGISDGQ
jgi:hypothetical protein